MDTTANNTTATAVLMVAAGLAQLVVGFFTFTAIGLVGVPVWAIVLLAGLWVAGAAVLARNARRAPALSLAVPVVNALLLWGIVAVGGAWLGWSA